MQGAWIGNAGVSAHVQRYISHRQIRRELQFHAHLVLFRRLVVAEENFFVTDAQDAHARFAAHHFLDVA